MLRFFFFPLHVLNFDSRGGFFFFLTRGKIWKSRDRIFGINFSRGVKIITSYRCTRLDSREEGGFGESGAGSLLLIIVERQGKARRVSIFELVEKDDTGSESKGVSKRKASFETCPSQCPSRRAGEEGGEGVIIATIIHGADGR